jgi:hypothetical protein
LGFFCDARKGFFQLQLVRCGLSVAGFFVALAVASRPARVELPVHFPHVVNVLVSGLRRPAVVAAFRELVCSRIVT